ncbi:MAG TPA: branched-chain amino acid ABC transporter permease [Rubrivivax sp.]|nr:branched-chain amino acid ABC transporter permease [Rubrivivax sp.]
MNGHTSMSPLSPPVAARAPRWRGWLVFALVTVAGLFVPMVLTSGFYLGLLINGLVLGIAAVGIGFLMNQCGLVMFGVAAFIGLPAYLLGILTMQFGLGVQTAVLLALLGSTAFAALVGALVVRARPLPFAMLTLALAQMLKSASTLQLLRPITGGDDGLTMSFNGSFLGLTQAQLAKAATFWPVAWVALCGVIFIVWAVVQSRFGRVLRATQANEERMRFSGFDTYLPRLAAFVLASFVISIAGLLMALNSAFASPELLDFATGGHALVATLVGGATTVGGPLLGALLYTWGQDAFGATGYLELLTGIAVVVMIAVFPRGAMGFVLRMLKGRL